MCLYLIMEASAKVMWCDKEMICPLRSIPVRPFRRDQLDRAAHHPRRLEGQGETRRRQVACRVNRCVEPICLLGISGPNRARQQEPVHEDLRGKHVVQAPRVFLQQLLVVFSREIIDKHLEPPNRIIVQHITSTSCILLAT